MSTTISCPAGFFQDDSVTPATTTDLLSAVAAAEAGVAGALTAEANAAASAAAAAVSETNAAGSAASTAADVASVVASEANAAASAATATTQAGNASSSASAAAGSAGTATTQAGAASTSASNAGTSATNAANSASAASTSASNASISETNAANSASAASTSETNAATSATTAGTNAATVSGPNMGRNLFHNPTMRIVQRGFGPWTTSASVTADRWYMGFSGGTYQTDVVALTDAARTAIGDESGIFCLQCAVAGGSAAGNYAIMKQQIESARTMAGKPVIVSFWAKALSGTPKVSVNISQIFGTGGSPSAQAYAGTGVPITLSTTWTRYSAAITVPSVAGQTFGTNVNTDYVQVEFWMSAGSTYSASVAGSIGVQSATFQFWGFQVEQTNVLTPLDQPDVALDKAKCLRVYSTGTLRLNGYSTTGGFVGGPITFAGPMRVAPTIAVTWTTQTNCTGNSNPLDQYSFQPYGTVTATGAFALLGTFTASAEF